MLSAKLAVYAEIRIIGNDPDNVGRALQRLLGACRDTGSALGTLVLVDDPCLGLAVDGDGVLRALLGADAAVYTTAVADKSALGHDLVGRASDDELLRIGSDHMVISCHTYSAVIAEVLAGAAERT